ncbi:MAG: hypothetical protein R3C12_25290 [Planctomycetaceae bacterium]|nr:hypothetical protein [Planctomycetaceae bacterium]
MPVLLEGTRFGWKIAWVVLICLPGCGEQQRPERPAVSQPLERVDGHPSEGREAGWESAPPRPDALEASSGGQESNHSSAEQVPVPPLASVPERNVDEQALREIGIEVFRSRSLILLVDQVSPEERIEFAQLPHLVDAWIEWLAGAYPELLRQAERETLLPLTGHVMREPALFVQAGLLPEELADLNHGKDRGRDFWLVDQPTHYYRRHLLLHEALHCVMNARPHQWPVWYLEGMAERMAIHERDGAGRTAFAMMPDKLHVEGGFGRIGLLREEVRAGRFRTLTDVQKLDFGNFYPHKTSYAWSWAFCYFLSRHPATAEDFTTLTSARQSRDFHSRLKQLLSRESSRLEADWAVFLNNLVPGYDFENSRIHWNAPDADDAEPPGTTRDFSVQVNRHWQNSGISVTAGTRYRISAEGHYVLGVDPLPWESEPQGVSLAYVSGRPRGELQMVLYQPGDSSPARDFGFTTVIPVGRQREWQAPTDGTLFFRINEIPSEWGDNTGPLRVRVMQP